MKTLQDSLLAQANRLLDQIAAKESKINRIKKALRGIKYDKKRLENSMKIENE